MSAAAATRVTALSAIASLLAAPAQPSRARPNQKCTSCCCSSGSGLPPGVQQSPANSSPFVAAIRRRRRGEGIAQSVHDLMHENTMTDATAVLISGSSHTASCQLNGMKILPLASRIEHVSISVCCPPPTRLQKGSSTYSYTADAMVLDLDNLQQPRSDSARNETFFVTDLAAGDNASNHRIS